MRLTKGSMMVSSKVGSYGLPAIGVLLYSKGCYWHYALTSPRHEDGVVITSVFKEKRSKLIAGIKN